MNPKEIGEILKTAREKKNLNIDKVYNATRIQPNIIESLEQGRADEVLSRVYVLLFLKKYASFLGLDVDNLVANYKALYAEKEDVVLEIKKEPLMAGPDIEKWTRLAIYGTTVLLLLLLIFSLSTRPPKSETPAPAKPIPKEDSKVKTVFPIPEDKPIDLVLNSKEDVWMKVEKDGKIVFQDTLRKDKEKSFSANEKIDLWIGRAEALEFSINGTPIGKVGSGRIKSIQISRQGIKIGNKWLLKSEK